MAQLQINLSKIKYNGHVLNALCSQNNICFTPVTKCVAGDSKIIEVLKDIGMTHFADARIDNITKSKDTNLSFAMIGTTNQYELEDVVRYTNISIQTEIETIRQLNNLAGKQQVKHQILLMVDWKDAREGILTYDVIDYIKENDVPEHPLYAKGYTSIGCAPCSRPIQNGENNRSGRWWWEDEAPKECGMNCTISTGNFEREAEQIFAEIRANQ